MTAQDTGGQSFRLSQAVTRYTSHESRSFRRSPDYLDFPADITPQALTKRCRREFVADYLASADIVHCHNMYRYASGWGAINPDAKWLIHQHGRIPTARIDGFLEADRTRGALRFVSTLNLVGRYAGGDTDRWIPAPLDLAAYDTLSRTDHEGFVIAHSPTNRAYKGTDLLLSVCDELGCKVELIEGVSHAESVLRKAGCDAVYDQMHLCYGNSGLEGMALGLPVFVGMAEATHALVERVVGYRPYITVAKDTLKGEIARLMADVGYARECGERGRAYVERFHDERKVAAKMAGVYEAL